MKVIIGLSGGVDSSVAAHLLMQEGYTVEGLFMKNWEQDDYPGFCAAEKDLQDAEAVCSLLNIPLHTINFSKQYWQHVFQLFLDEYAAGITPNPDILCNKEIKFKYFLQHAIELGADYIATGHYARTKLEGQQASLYQAKDKSKDQTYFLHAVDKKALNKTLFPLGSYLKSEVRQIASDLNFPNHDKKDSTGICFIGEKNFKSFLKDFLLAKPGDMVTPDGKIIGQHEGVLFYTIGQRQGLGLGGQKGSLDMPWFVVAKNIEQNQLVVAQGEHHPLLYSQGLICDPIHYLCDEPTYPLTCLAKIRYRQDSQHCLVSAKSDDGQHVVYFSEPQRAVTPGQYIVLYDQQHRCLGGAKIIRSI